MNPVYVQGYTYIIFILICMYKLTKHTQFIVITHRRGTMAAADRLYGITMQEKGVSTLVSVDLIANDLNEPKERKS